MPGKSAKRDFPIKSRQSIETKRRAERSAVFLARIDWTLISSIYPLIARFNLELTGNFGSVSSHPMSEDTEILREIRDLLQLIAEPAIAKRDERLRILLQEIVGKSRQKAEAVMLMDGTRPQAAIRQKCGMDPGNLSRLVKTLRTSELIASDEGQLKLVFPLPPNFFDGTSGDKK